MTRGDDAPGQESKRKEQNISSHPEGDKREGKPTSSELKKQRSNRSRTWDLLGRVPEKRYIHKDTYIHSGNVHVVSLGLDVGWIPNCACTPWISQNQARVTLEKTASH